MWPPFGWEDGEDKSGRAISVGRVMEFSDFSVDEVIFPIPIMNTIINAWTGQVRSHRGTGLFQNRRSGL